MVKILHVIGSMDCGGAESLIMDIFRGIDRTKVMFDFAVHTKKKGYFDDEIKSLGGKIFYFSKFNGFNGKKYKKEWRDFFANHHEHKIVHGHIGSSASLYLKVAKEFNRFAIAHSHSSGFDRTLKGFGNRFFSFKTRFVADYFFACSQKAGLNTYGKRIVLKSNNYSLLKNGISVEKYLFSNKKRFEIRKKLGIEENSIVIGNVGRLTYAKNHLYLVKIFAKFHEFEKNSYLIIVGDGEYKQKIMELATNFQIEKYVICTGFISNVSDYLNSMDFYVFPSFYEGLPISVIEAQANGLPCLLSDTITSEVSLTHLVKYLSIKSDPLVWSKAIFEQISYERKSEIDNIRKEGFDINETISFLEKFYLKIDERMSK